MPEKKTKPTYTARQNIGWMLAHAWKNGKSVLLLVLLLALIGVAINLAELFIAPQILQRVEQQASVTSLLATIGLFAGALFLLNGLQRYVLENALYGRIGLRTGLIAQINRKTHETAYPNLLDPAVLKLMSRAGAVTGSNDQASEHIWSTLSMLLTNLIGFAVYLALLSGLNPVLMLAVVATTALSFFISRRTDTWRYRHREEEADYDKKLYYIQKKAESRELAKDIRIFGLAPWLQELRESIMKLYEAFILKSEKQKLLGNIADVLLGVLRNGVAYFYLIRMALVDGLPASRFLLYFTAVSGFTAWITGILGEFVKLHKEGLELNAIRDYLDTPEPFRFTGGLPLPDLSKGCELRLEKVSFRYPGAEADTIHQLDLTVKPGEKLAIVGLNGAGKTTLVKLLCGLLDPSEGRVLLGGVDIRDFNRRDYYAQLSTVFQDFAILDVSVAENVAQRVDGIDRERVRDCLALAGLCEKIESLPGGIDAKLGRDVWEEGVLLSGGETQRLMLARALYRDAPLLLLDEPTAALDPLAESDIYSKYNEMTCGKTAVFVSHRLASTRFCDRILFLADGKIAEEGSHETLLAKDGEYAKLFAVQSRYYQEGRDF
ncbi:MAG: ABC transporter ATP-binding protein [Oscillospiraceae bacterium]|nr:ABC transporter ATP-binding protein [Oscillospiraceae bacterium]